MVKQINRAVTAQIKLVILFITYTHTRKQEALWDQDAELPSIQRAASKGTVQLLGHASHRAYLKPNTRPLMTHLTLSFR